MVTSNTREIERVAEVKEFTEKPNLATAEKMLAAGDYCWNSGILFGL